MFDGQSRSLPDQVAFQTVDSCSSHESTNAYSGTASYQKKLNAGVTVAGNYTFALADQNSIYF